MGWFLMLCDRDGISLMDDNCVMFSKDKGGTSPANSLKFDNGVVSENAVYD